MASAHRPKTQPASDTVRPFHETQSSLAGTFQRRSHRLLIYWWYDRGPARLGRGDRRGSSLIGCPPIVGVAQIWHAFRRSPWRGEAPEGTAQLEVALPSSPDPTPVDRGEQAWDRSSSAWMRTSGS